MSTGMPMGIPDRYDPAAAEARWYPEWEKRGFFHTDATRPGTPYCIVIPPPNVTGSLHMGHALNNTLQDVMIRMKRMDGFNALWVPGTDHAGIATQYVVERQLANEGKTKEDLGRTAFLDRVWKWKAESGGTIIRQLVRASLRRRAHLSRRLHRQLVPALPDGAGRPRGRARGARRRLRLHQVWAADPRHRAPGDEAR
jgi:hypothetical protein